MDTQQLSEEATLKRFADKQERTARDFGYGDTEGALKITEGAIDPLISFIKERIDNPPKWSSDPEAQLLLVIRNLPVETTALCALTAALGSIALGSKLVDTARAIAQTLEAECWAQNLLETDKALAQRVNIAVRRKHGNLKYRRQAARSIAARCGFRVKNWTPTLQMQAGTTLIGYLLQALPHLFVTMTQERFVDGKPHTDEFLTITEGALETAEEAVETALRRHPVFLPMTAAPKPWTCEHWFNTGARFRSPVVRTYYRESQAAIRAALKDGTMQPVLDALNALQGTAWTINERVLGVIRACMERGIQVKGLPSQGALDIPEKPKAWEDMSDRERRLWKTAVSKVKQKNRTTVATRVSFLHDLKTAEMLAEHDRFYTPMNLDWRGRVYNITHFNFQRDDRVRALFLFADGEPIDEEGLYWLKVHVANCGDFSKISKRPFNERVKWVDDNLQKIEDAAVAPLSERWWTNADKPFLFIAACMELTACLSSPSPPSYRTRLPVSFDGSCSGLQHLSAMTRDADTAKLVNLTADTLPHDVYQAVADVVKAQLEYAANLGADSAAGECGGSSSDARNQTLARGALEFGVDRKLVKRNVMTYSYSSKKFGMGQQLVEDLMLPLEYEVLEGKREVHPFASPYDTFTDKYGEEKHMGDGGAAAKYLAGLTYEAITQLVNLPAQAMTMLQKCARAMAHEGKPVTWTTPLGLPWINRYHDSETRRLCLWLHDRRVTLKVADGHKKTIDKERSANGVAPNFVHALDACHLLMVARACASENITQLATVHDSFGCLAPKAGRFRQIIREQFVKLYEEHDVLAEVLDECKRNLTPHNQLRLLNVPPRGQLNLKEVINAEFAFA